MDDSKKKNGAPDAGEGLDWLEGDRKLLGGIQGLFVKNVPGQMEKLNAAFIAGDASRVEMVSHSIKGAAAMIGALSLRDEAYRVEQAAMEGNLDEAHAHFHRMSHEMTRVLASLLGR